MGSKKLIKKGFISVISACLVLSSSFNAYALKPLEWKKSIKIIDENGKELSTGANIERGTTLYADLYFSVDPQSYEVQWYVDGELEGTGEEFTVPEGDKTVGFYVSVEGEGPAELTSSNKYFSFGTGQFYLMPGTGGDTESGDSGSMGDSEKEEVIYTLELTGTPSASEELTGLFSPIEKVGGMCDISYIWYINGNATTSESGYKKESTTYTVNDWDEGEVYVEAYFEDINNESQQIQSNTLTIEKDTGEGDTGDTGNTDNGADDTGNKDDTGNTDNGADDTGNKDDTGNTDNESTDNKDEAGDTEDKGDTGTGEEDGTGDTGTGEEGSEGGADTDNSESGENTGDKEDTDSGTGEDGSLDDDVSISTPSDAEKEENSGKDEEDKTDNNNSNIDTDNNNNNNSSNSSNSNNSNSHSSSSHSSSKSTNSEASEVYRWEFVNYKNENYKWFWRSNKGNVYKGWLQCPLDGYWYYFDLEEGYMLEGLQVIEGKTYYFQKQEETPSQTYYFEGDTWNYKKPLGGTNPWGSMLNIEF